MNPQFLLNGSRVKRYHAVDTIKEDLVGRHSHGVAMLAWAMTGGEASSNLLMRCLVHDLGEQNTGDMPSHTKRALGQEAMDKLDALEEEGLAENGLVFFLTPDEENIAKIADCLDGMLFCVRERRLGNKNMRVVFNRYWEYVRAQPFPGEQAWNIVREVVSLWRFSDEP